MTFFVHLQGFPWQGLIPDIILTDLIKNESLTFSISPPEVKIVWIGTFNYIIRVNEKDQYIASLFRTSQFTAENIHTNKHKAEKNVKERHLP
jgi:hypothetical protein